MQEQIQAQEERNAPDEIRKKRILIVDDDLSILEVFKVIFEEEGYIVDIADTASDAIRKTAVNFYNIALLDIKLPDMDGTELLSKLRDCSPLMMNIMVTGYPGLDNAVKSLNLGADAYVMKPVNPDKLLSIVKEKLAEQEEAENMSEEKLAQWIESRIRKIEGIRSEL